MTVGGIMSVSSHQEHDDAVHAVHAEQQAALARGENRALYLTEDGMLHSYTKTELGGPPNGSTGWWQNLPGLLVLLPMLGLTLYVIVTDPGKTATRSTRKERLRRGSPDPLKIMRAKTKLPESCTQSQPIKKSRW